MTEEQEDQIIICRCEDITLREIRDLIRRGYQTMDEIKRASRAGMGQCQGRTCRSLIAQEIAQMTGQPLAEVRIPTFRPPIRPVKLGVLAEAEE
ncbi:MAG: (2Fe-2S)-binding protein [Firmicutes bacterium]|nr:(2Fe-2S)-binding protein [Bacillota bacterium]MCL5038986.1 (2Fe-2S)-binding protein [Bacillota bacterium]